MCTTKTDTDCFICHGKGTVQVYRYDFSIDLEKEKSSLSEQLRNRMRDENAVPQTVPCPMCSYEEDDVKGKPKPGTT